MKESLLQRDVRLRFGAADDCAMWRNNVGVAEFVSPAGLIQRVSYGLAPGSSDLIGLVSFVIEPRHIGKRVGRFVGAELKPEGARTEKNRAEAQRLFRELINRMGGHAEELRTAAQVEEFLRRARELHQ